MSEINLNNYEAYMLDYFEGNLSNEQIIALKAFAVLHPELDLNFDEELVQLENETIRFSDKQNLKASFSDDLVIGYLENTLTDKEKKEADALAKTNAVFIKELDLYKKTIAQADERIVFENKAQLKREPKVIFFTQATLARIAAAVILLFGFWLLLNKTLLKEGVIAPEISKNEYKQTISSDSGKYKPEIKTISSEEKQLAVTSANSKTHKKKTVTLSTPNTYTLTQDAVTNTATATSTVGTDNTPKLSYLDTNAVKLTANTPEKKNTYIIEVGSDDEYTASAAQPKKNKLLSLASKAFKRLNQNGVSKVNGSDNDDALYIGALTISKAAQ